MDTGHLYQMIPQVYKPHAILKSKDICLGSFRDVFVEGAAFLAFGSGKDSLGGTEKISGGSVGSTASSDHRSIKVHIPGDMPGSASVLKI